MARVTLRSQVERPTPLETGWQPRPSSTFGRAARPLLLASSDGLLLLTASLSLRSVQGLWLDKTGEQTAFIGSPQTVAPFVFGVLACLAGARLYDPGTRRSLGAETARIAGAVSFVSMALALAGALVSPSRTNILDATFLWAEAMVFLCSARSVARVASWGLRHQGIGWRTVVVVGSPDTAASALQWLRDPQAGYRVLGLVSLESHRANGGYSNGLPVLGGLDVLPQIVQQSGACEILLTVRPHQYGAVREAVQAQMRQGTVVRLALPPFLDGVEVRTLEALGGLPALRLRTRAFPWEYETVKRGLDLVATLGLLLIAAPLIVVIGVAIKLGSPGPVLFRQTRVGRGGALFHMYKFRSMQQDAERRLQEVQELNEASGAIFKVRRDPRVTRVGAIIRRLSLDELPQLFNVLQGNMSLVGPRPPLPHEVEKYERWQLQRLDATPGLTGLWQVERTGDLSFEEMVRLDLQYMEEWSVGLDLKILLKTVPAMLAGRGAC